MSSYSRKFCMKSRVSQCPLIPLSLPLSLCLSECILLCDLTSHLVLHLLRPEKGWPRLNVGRLPVKTNLGHAGEFPKLTMYVQDTITNQVKRTLTRENHNIVFIHTKAILQPARNIRGLKKNYHKKCNDRSLRHQKL